MVGTSIASIGHLKEKLCYFIVILLYSQLNRFLDERSDYLVDMKVNRLIKHNLRNRPYHEKSTTSRLICEVKLRQAWVVLGWVTTGEVHVLITFIFAIFYRFWYNYSVLLVPPLMFLSILIAPVRPIVH